MSYFDNVKNWILNSGIIIADKNDENYGAVYSHFDTNKKKYGFLYPEIVGYTISALSFLFRVEKNDRYLEMAKASYQWLAKIFDDYGGIIQGIEENNESRKEISYSFDTSICAKGLLDLYSISKNDTILECGKKLVDWLTPAIEENGTIKPFFNIKTGKFEDGDNVWYKKRGCWHLKTCIPLLQLYKITNQESLLSNAKKICDNYSKFQNEDGSFSIHENSSVINLHTQCYALEGLLHCYHATQNHQYIDSFKKAAQWCEKKINDDGSVNLWFNFKQKSKAVYPVAQLIRLFILTDVLQGENRQTYTEKFQSFLKKLQAKDDDKRANGGFYEELYKSVFGWKTRQKINSWGSLFALQALYWYDNYDRINFDEEIPYLY